MVLWLILLNLILVMTVIPCICGSFIGSQRIGILFLPGYSIILGRFLGTKPHWIIKNGIRNPIAWYCILLHKCVIE